MNQTTMTNEEIKAEFEKKFYPFIAYRTGGKVIDYSGKSGIEVVEQLEHCEKEVLDYVLKTAEKAREEGRREGEESQRMSNEIANSKLH